MMFTLMFGSYSFPNQTFEIAGLPIENNIQETKIPLKHGSNISTPYLNSRKIRISGTLHNQLSEDTHTQLLDMQEALLAGEGKFYYRSDRYANCYVKNIKPVYEEGTDKAVARIEIDLVAQDPFLYSETPYSAAEDASGTTHSFDVFSGGDVFAEPNIYFYASGGTISNNLLLQNLTTGEQMRWRGILNPGQTLSVNSGDMEVSYDILDGMSIFEGDFPTLLPGTNSFQFVGEDCRITVEHRWRYYA
jgi:phage-related protein